MNQEKSIDFSFHIDQEEIQNIKYFVIKQKQYPINFNKLKNNSKYFYRNRKQFKYVNEISLFNETDDGFDDISEEAIQAFIASCQNEPCKINQSDVIPLQYLSYKFEFPKLISITEKFIQENFEKIVLHSILFKLKCRPNKETFSVSTAFFNTKKEEEVIIEHLNYFIHDDQLLLLPLPVLDRILHKSDKKILKQTCFVDFLFKCLDKYGESASLLFSYVDFEDQSIGVTNKLIQNYSDIFNFNFLNSTLLKTTIQLTSEVT